MWDVLVVDLIMWNERTSEDAFLICLLSAFVLFPSPFITHTNAPGVLLEIRWETTQDHILKEYSNPFHSLKIICLMRILTISYRMSKFYIINFRVHYL